MSKPVHFSLGTCTDSLPHPHPLLHPRQLAPEDKVFNYSNNKHSVIVYHRYCYH